MEESLIIEKCQSDNPSAQRELYELYLPYVVMIVRRFGISNQDVADVIQEIFIEVFVNIKQYSAKKGAFKYWLKSVTIHKILNIQRKQNRTKETLFFNSEKIENVEIEGVVETINDLDNEFLVQLVQSLPDGYRTVFNLYVIDNFSHKEISKKLGIDAATSRSQLARAKQLLRKKLLALKKGNRYGLI